MIAEPPAATRRDQTASPRPRHDPERLFQLLREAGYRLTLRQQLEAEKVLALAAAGVFGPDEPDVATLLAPIVVKTPSQQEDVRRRLAVASGPKIIATVEPGRAAAKRGLGKRGLGKRVVRRWWTHLAIVAVALSLSLVGVAAWYWYNQEPPIGPAAPSAPAAEQQTPPPTAAPGEIIRDSFTIERRITHSAYPAVLAAIAALPIALFAGWIVLRWWRRQLWMSRGRLLAGDPTRSLSLPKLTDQLFSGPAFREAALALRRHRRLATTEIDVLPTVLATAAEAGRFAPVLKQRPVTPEHLVLIEEKGRHDHLARLFDVAVERLSREGVALERYYFQGDPQHLLKDNRARTPVSLHDVVARGFDQRLVVIAIADGFFHPVTGELQDWVRERRPFSARALLHTAPLESWAEPERALHEEDFTLGTASKAGLEALSERLAVDDGSKPVLLQGIEMKSQPRLPAGRVPSDEASAVSLPLLRVRVAALGGLLAARAAEADNAAVTEALQSARAALDQAAGLLGKDEQVLTGNAPPLDWEALNASLERAGLKVGRLVQDLAAALGRGAGEAAVYEAGIYEDVYEGDVAETGTGDEGPKEIQASKGKSQLHPLGMKQDDADPDDDYTVEVIVKPVSQMVGKKISDLDRLGDGEIVISRIIREGFRRYIPSPELTLYAGDVLLLEGDFAAVKKLVHQAGLRIAGTEKFDTMVPPSELGTVAAVIAASSPLIGHSAVQLQLHDRFGVSLIAIHRPNKRIENRIGRTKLHAGDIIVLYGKLDRIEETLEALGCQPITQRSSTSIGSQPDQSAQTSPDRALTPLAIFDIAETWCPEMVVIPAGEFLMGSPEDEEGRYANEGPQHLVRVPSFAMGRYPVTVGEFAHFVEETGHDMSGGAYVWTGKDWKHDPARSWRSPGFEQTEQHPVVCVSWNDAQAYVDWLTRRTGQAYRLPSEAEWEYACRAGTITPFWTGATISTDQANYDGNYTYGNGRKGVYRERTVAVDEPGFPANPFGLFHMHGNVWEWCEDIWHDSYEGAPVDSSAWLKDGDPSRRVVRGGSWYIDPGDLRSASRDWDEPVDRGYDLGFRVSRTLTP